MPCSSEKYRKIDRRFLWHPYSSHSAIQKNDFPVIVRGQGPYLFDREGRRYFDAISSWWCCNLGHNHPRLVKAIKIQAGKLQHSMLGNMSHPPAIELAENIAGLFKLGLRQLKTLRTCSGQVVAGLVEAGPGSPTPATRLKSLDFKEENRRVFFSSDGSSAVEAAIKIAVQYWHNIGRPKRCRLVSLEGAYHGDTLGSVSAGFLPQFHLPFKSLTFPVYRARAPFCAKCSFGLLPDTCQCECFESMRLIIEKHYNEIAAVIVEPLCQCAAGMRIYSPAYLNKLAALCRKHDILLIADEIAVGFGRTGTMFAFEQAGIDPDIVCLGKGLAGGYLPISATVVKERIYAAFRDAPKDHTFYHGHTFAGNPLACAAAIEVLKIYREENIARQAKRKGEMMREKMAGLQSIAGIKNVRSLGMISAVELSPEKENKISRAQMIKKELMKHGVLIRPLGNVIYLMPPLTTPDNLLADTINLLAEALESLN